MTWTWLAVFIGGGLGSLCRYGLSKATIPFFVSFPIQTLLSNLLASTLLGVLTAFFLFKSTDVIPAWKLFAATGFCGGFSTFSTFGLETFQLLQAGRYWMAVLYVLLSVLICLASLALGFYLMRLSS